MKNKRLDWHPEAIAELAESLAWYARRNPVAAKRMSKVEIMAVHYNRGMMYIRSP